MSVTLDPAGSAETKARLKALVAEGRTEEAWAQVRPLLLAEDDPTVWYAALSLLRSGTRRGWSPPHTREIRLAILCTYEATELVDLLQVACSALGVATSVYTAPYGQLEQEVLSDESGLAGFAPTHVLISPTAADLSLPELADDPDAAVESALRRWTALWAEVGGQLGARVLQHSFVVPAETPFGHLALRLAGSRPALVRALNSRLGGTAGDDVLIVDCDRLASQLGKAAWFDPRLWYAARRPYGPRAQVAVARATAAVLAADVGLAARCVIVDLDNTLWGGVVGDDGVDGITVGQGPEGEAFSDFQAYLAELANRGLLLAVASKNDQAAAREPFDHNEGMRLRLDDFAAFVTDWRRKPEQIVEIARTLDLGLEYLVFVDDNPAECAEVAAALPSVDTICLDVPPSEFVRVVAASPRFEISALTSEDLARQRSYRARSQAERQRQSSASLEDFWRSLEMRARVRPIDDKSLERAAQLTQKTNQFNLTLLRRTRDELDGLRSHPRTICRTLELEDRYANHGIVGLAIAVPDSSDPKVAVIDTLLFSCRVIGRTAEIHLLSHLSRAALDERFTTLRGVYVPGPRNALVADLYARLGFVQSQDVEPATWDYDLVGRGPFSSEYISDGE